MENNKYNEQYKKIQKFLPISKLTNIEDNKSLQNEIDNKIEILNTNEWIYSIQPLS